MNFKTYNCKSNFICSAIQTFLFHKLTQITVLCSVAFILSGVLTLFKENSVGYNIFNFIYIAIIIYVLLLVLIAIIQAFINWIKDV